MFEFESVETASTFPLIRLHCAGSKEINNWLPLQQDWSTRWSTLSAGYAGSFASHIDELETRDDDVFLVTYPKCGTTWMQELAWLLLNQLDFERASSVCISERSVYLEQSANSKKLPMNSIQSCDQMTSPRLIKTHLPAQLLPRQVWQQKRKIIYVTRNPKDVVVSSYHFHVGLGHWAGDFDAYVNEFINNKIVYSSYWTHFVDFWRMRHEPNIFFVTYEQMKSDLQNVIEKLSEFLGVHSLSAQEMQQLMNHLTFDNMKQSKCTNLTGFFKKIKNATDNFEFMRRGIVGAFNDELSENQKQKLDKCTSEILSEYNLKESDIFGDLNNNI
ncbi:sulfotransferase 1E1-like [Drosophila busckii]|uniref:sulfotransferase 1E1-like n=1 Tax=Drosophila busckii TaxID=30019 RepID=UPI00083F2AF1|nr:sulfotransferase 1E1-like [Drosophila busckii]